jgi:hypothetical protein
MCLLSAFLHVHIQTLVNGIYPFRHLVVVPGTISSVQALGASPRRLNSKAAKAFFLEKQRQRQIYQLLRTLKLFLISDRFKREERFLPSVC